MELDKEIVLMCAVSYALGRMTYVVSSVCNELKLNYENLSDNTKYQIAKEIQEYQDKHGLAGMEMDNEEWNKVKWLFNDNHHVDIEANLYQTDKWKKVKAVKGDNGIYYSIPKMLEYHTVRELKEEA